MGRFERNLSMGHMGESLIARWLQSRGHAVFPAYQIEYDTGKGPQLFSADGNCVLPDLLVFRNGSILWFEAKHKTCFTWHWTTERWTTGIDLRHYKEYLKVAQKTQLPVWLLFFHPNAVPAQRDVDHGCPSQCPTGLFGGDLKDLERCESHRSYKWGPSGMVYWAESSLRLIASVEELSA